VAGIQALRSISHEKGRSSVGGARKLFNREDEFFLRDREFLERSRAFVSTKKAGIDAS